MALHASVCAINSEPLYYYRIRSESIMSKYTKNHIDSLLKIQQKMIELYNVMHLDANTSSLLSNYIEDFQILIFSKAIINQSMKQCYSIYKQLRNFNFRSQDNNRGVQNIHHQLPPLIGFIAFYSYLQLAIVYRTIRNSK